MKEQQNTRVIAIAIADIHASHECPRARKAEPSWYAAMEYYFFQLRQLLKHHDNPPLLIAGDIFHTSNEPAELVNFLLSQLPNDVFICTIPGQHDLLHHNIDDVEKTPYWTLCKINSVVDISHITQTISNIDDTKKVVVTGFPWGSDLQRVKRGKPRKGTFNIALVHKYVWMKNCNYPNAKSTAHVEATAKQLKGFDLVISGDNHIPFIAPTDPPIINCGCFIPRRVDEQTHTPAPVLIYADGGVDFFNLDSSKDKWIDCANELDSDKLKKDDWLNVGNLMREFEKLTDQGIDFLGTLKQAAQNKKLTVRAQQLLDEIRAEVTK